MAALSRELAGELQRGVAMHALERVADLLFENAAECYAMMIDDEEDYAAVGNTRFGGEPDLPASIQWPCNGHPENPDSRFSNFIAQINFAELPPLSGGSPLPHEGLLLFFVRHMECAAEPVLLDTVFYDGDISVLNRTSPPDPERLADECLVELRPQKIRAIPATSIAVYRRDVRSIIDDMTQEIDEKDGNCRLAELESDLCRDAQIGQLLGFANPADDQQDLYRQVHLTQLGRRELMYNDYWNSVEEYEAYMEECRREGDHALVEEYEAMRNGVKWLAQNREMIARGAADWRLLLRIDSNVAMNLNIMDGDCLYTFIHNENLTRHDLCHLAGEVTQG